MRSFIPLPSRTVVRARPGSRILRSPGSRDGTNGVAVVSFVFRLFPRQVRESPNVEFPKEDEHVENQLHHKTDTPGREYDLPVQSGWYKPGSIPGELLMMASTQNRAALFLGCLFVLTLILAWWLPAAAAMLVRTLLGLSFALASLSAVQRNWVLYQQGKITGAVLIRNTVLEVLGIILVMLLASLLGRQVAQVATNQIEDLLAKFLAGIGVGLLVGLGTGFLVRRVWGWLGLSL